MTTSGVRSILWRLGKQAGVKNVHSHRFRHTFAIMILRNGGNIYTLQHALGHRSPDMVKHYLDITQQDLAAVK